MTTTKSGIVTLASAAALLLSLTVGSGAAMARPRAVSTAGGNNIQSMNCKVGTRNCVPAGSGNPVRCGGVVNPCRVDGGPTAWDPFLLPGGTGSTSTPK